MAQVLVLFLMTAFAKTLELVWRNQDSRHMPAMFRSKKLTTKEGLQCLYVVDDGEPSHSE